MAAGLHGALVEAVAGIAAVQETTDLNDDCSRCLYISGAPGLTLRLSLVGSYACLHDEKGRILIDFSPLGAEAGLKLTRLLGASDFRLMDEGALRETFQLGGEMRPLHEALFSRDGLLS